MLKLPQKGGLFYRYISTTYLVAGVGFEPTTFRL